VPDRDKPCKAALQLAPWEVDGNTIPGICLIGGHGASAQDHFVDHFTPAQKRALIALTAEIERRTAIARITGHNQYAAKACPGFHVPTWLAATTRS